MKKLFAITHVNEKLGLRQLTFGNQGRNHYPDRIQAEAVMNLFKPSLLEKKILSATEADSLEVREVECYDHGDAVVIYFGPEII